jgi:galactose oxidase-like protein
VTLRVRLGLVVATVMCITTGGLLASGRSQQPFAASGLPANTWVNLRAGGVVSGNGVGDEGYSTFVYSPGLKKGLVFAKYHAFEMGGGEDQNALLAYDFGLNRWDVLEITEDAWSEHLPGVGHDQGNVVIDPRRDWYITRGNMTLHGNTGYQTYIYDVRAGRGKRMTPAVEPNLYHSVASAFDPDRGVMLSTRGPAWLYDPDKNTWTEVGGSPSDRAAPALVYDGRNRVFVMFGGGQSGETWTFDAGSRQWRKRKPPLSPPARYAGNIAFDSDTGTILLVGGAAGDPLSDMWVYDTARDVWAPLPYRAPVPSTTASGNRLIYDSHNHVFLLKDIISLRDVWAFRYVPDPVTSR